MNRSCWRGLVLVLAGLWLLLGRGWAQTNPAPIEVPTGLPFQNPELPVAERVADLLGRLSLEEKVGLLETEPRAIPRLGIPSYSWWGESIRGVARAGTGTMFPVAIGLAASWDTNLMQQVATAVSDEARAKFRQVSTGRYHTLTFWAPAADLVRDPRWGRAQETYGEDPYLAGRMVVAYIRGMQGQDPKYLKTAATAKHFGMHGQETKRLSSSFDCPERWLHEYYFPPFREAVQEAGVAGIMAAHTGINSMPCHMNRWLLGDLLRDQWGFAGMIYTDLHGTRNLHNQHRAVASDEAAVAAVLNAGIDALSEWKWINTNILSAVASGLVSTARIDQAVSRGLAQRFQLGLFDPPGRVAYAQISTNVIGSAAHLALSRAASRASLVLLKNTPPLHRQDRQPLLPLEPRRLNSIAVLGPLADNVYMGAYTGTPAAPPVSLLSGIRAAVGDQVIVRTAPWFDADEIRRYTDRKTGKLTRPLPNWLVTNETVAAEAATEAALRADVVVVALGLFQKHEFEGKDRLNLELPKDQQDFLQRIFAINPATVVVLFSGGPLATTWIQQHVPAVVQAWLPGEQHGHGLAEMLFGAANPAGRLPVTAYASLDQLPPLEDYDLSRGRTYQYLTSAPLYPFGHGLSYTRFEYASLEIDRAQASPGQVVHVRFAVTNTGSRDGEEVVQLYVRHGQVAGPVPQKLLRGFARLAIPAGQTRTVTLPVPVSSLALWNEAARRLEVPSGLIEVQVGASSADIRLCGSFLISGQGAAAQ